MSASPSLASSARPGVRPRAAQTRPPRDGSADGVVAAELRRAVERLRLSEDTVAQMLHSDADIAARLPLPELQRVVALLLAEGHVPDPALLKLIGERLAELTGQPVSVLRLSTWRARVRRFAATAFACVLAPVCAYLVIGGLLAGESSLMRGESGLAALVAFASVLGVLAVFEALHISVAQLKTSDLSALRDRHPRAVMLHREFRTDDGIKRFLAGRQLVVVVTVFFVAGLSSFPDMSRLPGTLLAVPHLLRPFLDVGAPGALFVLWLGQLAPQFLATQRALRMMDRRLVGLAFRAAMVLESIGFAKPGFWLSSWDKTQERIPSSPALRWSQAALELEGTGVLTMTREWAVGQEVSTLRADTATAFYAEGRESHFDGSITLPRAASALAMTSELHPCAGERARELVGTSFTEEQLASGDRVLHKSAMPAAGSFRPGDVLVTRLAAQLDGPVDRDAVLIERPARALVWRATMADYPDFLPPARVIEYRAGDGRTDLLAVGEPTVLQPRADERGRLFLEHTVPFPPPGTLYVFEWHAAF